jgi:hypothetical protein
MIFRRRRSAGRAATAGQLGKGVAVVPRHPVARAGGDLVGMPPVKKSATRWSAHCATMPVVKVPVRVSASALAPASSFSGCAAKRSRMVAVVS